MSERVVVVVVVVFSKGERAVEQAVEQAGERTGEQAGEQTGEQTDGRAIRRSSAARDDPSRRTGGRERDGSSHHITRYLCVDQSVV